MSPQCAASETPAFIASVPLRENVAGVASFRCATSSRGPPVSMKSKRPARRQKRPRAGGSASGGASPAAHESNPARIKVNSTTLSLRQQLKLVQGREQASTPRQQLARTRYRKQKPDADFYQSQGGARGPEADLPDGKYDAQQQPVLYIDGYNIIGAWPRLRKHRDRGDLEDARRHLIDDVAEFSYMRGWACVVVFDACGNENPISISTTEHYVDVVYTGSDTADSFIERSVYLDCERGERQVWTATDDTALSTFSASKGAHRLSAGLFIQEMKYAKRESQERVQSDAQEGRMRAKMLISSVDRGTREALYKLRKELDGR